MAEEKPVKSEPIRPKGKTFHQKEQETLKGISDTISSDKSLQDRNIEFKIETNKAGDTEYHRYEDDNPNDTNPARLTGIFTQDQMDKAIQSRKEDSFYEFNKDKTVKTPVITDDDADVALDNNAGGGSRGSLGVFAVKDGNIISI